MPIQNFNGRIVEMFSAQGEKVELDQPVEAKGNEGNLRLSGSDCGHGPTVCTVGHIRITHSAEVRQLLKLSGTIVGVVEMWLQRLVEEMQHTMKAIIKRVARNVYEMDLQAFIFSHPAQTALLGIQFQWTADMQA